MRGCCVLLSSVPGVRTEGNIDKSLVMDPIVLGSVQTWDKNYVNSIYITIAKMDR